MSPTKQLPLRVSVKGVTNNMLNMLQYFFGNSRNSNCEIVNHELAELTIIDLDGSEGRRLLDEYQEKSPEHPLIILSLHNIEVENAILVPKPLKPEQLMKALDTLKQKIQSSKQLEEAAEQKQTEAIASKPEVRRLHSFRRHDDTAGVRDVLDSSVDIIVEATDEMLAVETEISEETEILREAEVIDQEKAEATGRETASVVNQAAALQLAPKPSKPEQLMRAIVSSNQNSQSSKQPNKAAEKKQTEALASKLEDRHPHSFNRRHDDTAGKQDISGSSVDITLEATEEVLAVEAEIPEKTEILRETKVINLEKTEVTGRETAPEVNQAAILSHTRDDQEYIGSAPDIDQDDPEQLASAQYNPVVYFQSHIQRAARKAGKYRKAVLLTMPHGSLVVVSDGKSALLDIKESRLHAFCAIPINDETLTMIFMEEDALQKYRANATPVALVQILWKAAIWASRGRFPIKTSLNNKVIFRDWPDISHLLLFPHALRIAALWADQPCSLIETARTLEIHQRYVFAFYSASNAIGIAYVRGGDGSENDRDDSKPAKKTRAPGLLNRMLNHLQGGK